MRKNYITVIGHPGNPKFPVPAAEFVGLCREYNKAIEINNSSFTHARKGSLPNCLAIAKEACAQKVDILLSSDAHFYTDVGNFGEALKVVSAAGIEDKQIININKEKIEHYFGGYKHEQ